MNNTNIVNDLKNHQEKFRPLETLVKKELEINERVLSEIGEIKDSVTEVLDYSDKEKERITELMKIVTEINDFIILGKPFSNSMPYNKFIIGYNLLNEREKKVFTKIYNELRVTYYFQKIRNNIKEKHSASLGNITKYLNELKLEFPDYDLKEFYFSFDKEEQEFIKENF